MICRTLKGRYGMLAGVLISLAIVVVGLGWWATHSQKSPPTKKAPQNIVVKITSTPLFEDTKASIPSGASSEMTEFLQNRATLENNFAKLHNQMLQANQAGTGSSSTAVDLEKLFHDQNEGLLKRQAQLDKIIAQQQAQKPLVMPPPLVIPSNASPQLKAYLVARDQLTRDRVQTMNKYRTANRQVQEAAMQQWQHQNADRLQHLRDLAQALPKPTASVGVANANGRNTPPPTPPSSPASN
jgi:hypothetical protein